VEEAGGDAHGDGILLKDVGGGGDSLVSGVDGSTEAGPSMVDVAPFRPETGLATFGIAKDGINGEQSVSSTAIGPTDGWKHMAIVLASGGATLYVDGISVATSSKVVLRPKDLGTIDYAWIGRSQFAANATFDGAFDEFRVYGRALSAGEITTIFQYTQP